MACLFRRVVRLARTDPPLLQQYIVSGRHFSMNFLMLAIQSIVSAASVHGAKQAGVRLRLFPPFLSALLLSSSRGADNWKETRAQVIDYPAFSWEDAKKWSPVSMGLVALMYSGSKALVRLRGVPSRCARR